MYVADANHQIMPHGDTLNPGDLFNYFSGFGYRLPQGVLILPKPGVENLYYIIHEKLEWSNQYFDVCPGLYYSIVDQNLNNGLGDVTLKNICVLTDSLDPGCITATRHANGRDWWIVVPKFLENKYFIFLLSPEGLTLSNSITIGVPSTMMELGLAYFSPDGSKYIRYGLTQVHSPSRLEVFNFDRCSGELSNYQNLWFVDSIYAPGLSISPNSRFMYVGRQLSIDQYDLQATNIVDSKLTVANYDFFIDPLFPQFGYTTFYLQQLAADNKIYICTGNGTRFLHVIDQPDSCGVACNVLQHSVQLPTFNLSSIPNFPNFRLGPIDGSTCDTLGINIITSNSEIHKEQTDFEIWPNPAQDYFNYRLNNQEYSGTYHLRLYNTSGILFKEWEFKGKQGFGHYSIEDIQAGVYLLTLTTSDERVQKTVKLVIVR